MIPEKLTGIDRAVAGWGVALSLGALFLSGADTAFDTGVGALMGLANWNAFEWFASRPDHLRNRLRIQVLLAGKTVVTLALVVWLLAATGVQPLPFLVGMSSLVSGIVTWAAVSAVAGIRSGR